MGLKERTYSILLVSGAESFNAALSGLLATASFSSITMVDSVSAAARKIAERSFDCVLINAPLVDDPGIRFESIALLGPACPFCCSSKVSSTMRSLHA